MESVQYLAVDLIDTCNATCENCAVNAPFMSHRVYDRQQLEKDLAAVSKVLHAETCHLSGGEPTLVPDLVDYALTIRDSGVSDKVYLFTNGKILDTIPLQHLAQFDHIYLPVYSSHPQEVKDRIYKAIDKIHSIMPGKVITREVTQFMQFVIPYEDTDNELVSKIFDNCSERMQCPSVRDGYFYNCCESGRHLKYLTKIGVLPKTGDDPDLVNGLKIDEPDFEGRFKAFRASKEPMKACRYCLGGWGKHYTHQQLTQLQIKSHGPKKEDIWTRLKLNPEDAGL